MLSGQDLFTQVVQTSGYFQGSKDQGYVTYVPVGPRILFDFLFIRGIPTRAACDLVFRVSR